MRKVIRFLLAIAATPVVFLFLAPGLAFIDYLADEQGAAEWIVRGWLDWVTFQ